MLHIEAAVVDSDDMITVEQQLLTVSTHQLLRALVTLVHRFVAHHARNLAYIPATVSMT